MVRERAGKAYHVGMDVMYYALRVALVLCVLTPLGAFAGASPPGPDAMPRPEEGASAPAHSTAPPGTYRMPTQAAAVEQPTQAPPSATAPQSDAADEAAPKPAFLLPPPPETGIKNAEQARLRLQDICMYASVAPDGPQGATAPRCACYAQALAKALSADDISAFAAEDELPETARERAAAIWERCKGSRS